MRHSVLRLVLMASGLLQSQQVPQDPPFVTFRAQTRLVLLSFHVARGKNQVPDLKRSDVILLEDGEPREFSIFDSPATQGRMPLELVLLFDTNPKIEYFWDPADVFRFVPHWTDTMSQTILKKEGADVRISVYRCENQSLYRMLPATSDAARVSAAFHRLLQPEAPHRGEPTTATVDPSIPLTMPPGRAPVDPGPFTGDYKTSPFISAESRGWPLEAAIGVLNEISAAQDRVSRILVMFSEGIGVSTTLPEDVGSQALDLGIPIYPIVTNYKHHIQFFLPRNQFRMHQFAVLARITGGRTATYAEIDAATLTKVLSDADIGGLSQYVVGFTPGPNGRGRVHNLEIRLAPKTGGTVEGGRRRAIY